MLLWILTRILARISVYRISDKISNSRIPAYRIEAYMYINLRDVSQEAYRPVTCPIGQSPGITMYSPT